MRSARVLLAMLFLLLPGVVALPVWRLAGLGAGEDDILYYFPSRVYFHQSVTTGQWPAFNPLTGLGRPFAADPQSAVWYPFTWLFAILPPIGAYPATLWLHFSVAMWGMYRLLRGSAGSCNPLPRGPAASTPAAQPEPPRGNFGRCAAVFGAVAFAFCGFMLAHRVHFTMFCAAAWTPWVFWRVRRYVCSGGVARLGAAALVAAMQCLAGHVQVSALTALATAVFVVADRARSPEWRGGPGGRRARLARVGTRWLLVWISAAGLFAIQLAPTLAYLRISDRGERSFNLFVYNSWNPVSATGWLLPMLFGQRTPNFFAQPYWGPSHQCEQFAYPGVLTLVLAVLALRENWRGDGRRRPWVVVAILGLLLALGRFGPIYPLLYWLPGFGLFGTPARALLLFNLSAAALAAIVVHDLTARVSPSRARLRSILQRWTRRPALRAIALVGACLAATLLAAPLLVDSGKGTAWRSALPLNPAVWIPLICISVSLGALGVVARRWDRPRLAWLLVGLLAIDLSVIGWTLDVPRGAGSVDDVLRPTGAPSVRFAAAVAEGESWETLVRRSGKRLWTVTLRDNGTPGEYIDPLRKRAANTNILAGIPALTDYGPIQPRRYKQRFGFADWGECPPERSEQLLSDTRWMRACNVGWVLLCDPRIPAPAGCELEFATPEMRLYAQPSTAGEVVLEDAARLAAIRHAEHSAISATTYVDIPGSSTGGADENARLIRATLHQPGWRARVNGAPVEIEAYDGVLQSVPIPVGVPVQVEWDYELPGLVPGIWITAAVALILAGFAIGELRRLPRGLRTRVGARGPGQESAAAAGQ